MASPFLAIVEELRALRGAPKVTYPSGDVDFPMTERVFRIKRGQHLPEFGQDEPDAAKFPDNVLTQQIELGNDPHWVDIYRRYEVVPGKAETVSVRIDPELNTTITTKRQLKLAASITEGATITGAGADAKLIATSMEDAGSPLFAYEVIEEILQPPARDEATALLGTRTMSFEFPGRINIPMLDLAGTLFGHQEPHARLIEATVKTWWVISSTKPSLSFSVILPKSIMINGVHYKHVLHDTTTRIYGTTWITIAGTTPTNAQYEGSWIGTSRLVDGEVTATRYHKLWKVEALYVVMR